MPCAIDGSLSGSVNKSVSMMPGLTRWNSTPVPSMSTAAHSMNAARARMRTPGPAAAKASAIPARMPADAPVTSTRFPATSKGSPIAVIHRRRHVERRVAIEEANGHEVEPDRLDGHDGPVLRPGDVRDSERVPEHDVDVAPGQRAGRCRPRGGAVAAARPVPGVTR